MYVRTQFNKLLCQQSYACIHGPQEKVTVLISGWDILKSNYVLTYIVSLTLKDGKCQTINNENMV